MVTPLKYRMLAARTCPAILAGADMSRTSSIRPTANMAPAASTTPVISGESGEDRAQLRDRGRGQHRHQEAHEHGGATAVGDRPGVHRALARVGHVADPQRDALGRDGQGGGRSGGHDRTRPYQPMSGIASSATRSGYGGKAAQSAATSDRTAAISRLVGPAP